MLTIAGLQNCRIAEGYCRKVRRIEGFEGRKVKK
jgi:hypothetical protein